MKKYDSPMCRWIFIIAFIVQVSASFNPFETYDEVQFIFVHGKSPYNNTRYTINNLGALINHQRFDSQRKTVLYCHGWVDDFEGESCQMVSKAYITRNDHNIIVLDWGQYSVTQLHVAVIRSSIISKHAGKSLLKLFQLGLDANKFHCVGHSIGAHMCGIIGREVIALSSGQRRLKRITALDAAFPFYYPPISAPPVSHRDAEFVDAIHTATFSVGSPYRIGHVDFYPNNGELQSGCPDWNILDTINNYCSHWLAYRYWSASLVFEELYPAKLCRSWSDFKSGRCEHNPINFMGYAALPGSQGTFLNEIIAKHRYFERPDSENSKYVRASIQKRSDIARYLRKVHKSLSW